MNNAKRIILILVATVGVGVICTTHTYAAGKRASDRKVLVGERFAERARQKLELTEQQTAQIKEALKSEKEKLSGLASTLREARRELRIAIHASDATETSVRVAAAKVSAVRADLAVERLVLHGKLKPILTAEQVEKVNTFRARRDERIEHRIKVRLSE